MRRRAVGINMTAWKADMDRQVDAGSSCGPLEADRTDRKEERWTVTNTKSIAAVLGVAALLVLAVACGNSEAATTPGTKTGAPSQGAPALPTVGAPFEQPSAPAASVRSGFVSDPGLVGASGASPALQVGGSQAGIWVTGEGTISLEPDLSLVNIGVETMAPSVVEARNAAATAMAAIVQAVKAHGLEDRDIQTRSFNIFPRYEFPEVTEFGVRVRKQTLVGYTVSNSAAIKIRDLDDVGAIVDAVADAGGDATRINGISFTVEDPKPFMADLREAAVLDALAKAQQLADLTGVSVGRLVFISEGGRTAPLVQQDFAVERAFSVAAAPPPTGISGGELELRLTVQAVFDIQ